jgi:hypothetical protein
MSTPIVEKAKVEIMRLGSNDRARPDYWEQVEKIIQDAIDKAYEQGRRDERQHQDALILDRDESSAIDKATEEPCTPSNEAIAVIEERDRKWRKCIEGKTRFCPCNEPPSLHGFDLHLPDESRAAQPPTTAETHQAVEKLGREQESRAAQPETTDS